MTYSNGQYTHLSEALEAQTKLLKEVRDHIKILPENLNGIAGEIKGIVKEMHAFNLVLATYSDPKTGYITRAIEIAQGKRTVTMTTHLITTAALAICLVAAILALTNSDMNYGDFYIGKKNNAPQANSVKRE